jgi:hypothetical protein
MFYLSWNWTKSGSTILHTLMLLMRIVWSFVWRKFSSVGKGEWCDEMKDGQKLKLGYAHVTPRNIQEVQASKLGDAQGTSFFINKNIRSSFKILYFYCFICYVLFLDRLYVSNVSIIFDAPCLFLHHLPCVSLHFVAFLCDFWN